MLYRLGEEFNLGESKNFLLINNKFKYFMNFHSYLHVSAFLQAIFVKFRILQLDKYLECENPDARK